MEKFPISTHEQSKLAEEIANLIEKDGLEFSGKFEDIELVLRFVGRKFLGKDSWND